MTIELHKDDFLRAVHDIKGKFWLPPWHLKELDLMWPDGTPIEIELTHEQPEQ